MFSVEDLLISHGYKLSKNASSSSENRCEKSVHEVTETRSGHGTLNGYETDSGTYIQNKKPLARGYFSDNEASHGSQKKPANAGSCHTDQQGLGIFQTSDGRLPGTAPIEWSSCPKTEKDITYWRRRGQDFSVLLSYNDKGNSKTKGSNTAKPEEMAESNSVFQNAKEGQRDVRQGVENAMRRNILDENWTQSADYQWPSLSTKGTDKAKMSAKQMSDGDGEQLLQEFYSFNVRDHALNSQNKGKSQSLPRVLSPESLRHVYTPILTNTNHSGSGDKLQSSLKNTGHLDSHKNSKAGCDFHNFLKPKYGRPLKPPSYELHQQAWGTVEGGGFQDNPQKDEYISFFPKVNEPKQDFPIQDSSLEPPVYVPPPSYKSPPQKNINHHSVTEGPHYNVCFSGVPSCLVEGSHMSQKTPSSIFKTEDEFCTDGHFPCEKQGQHHCIDNYIHSVQYIPFDDPRIRHIKLAQDEVQQDSMKEIENAIKTSPTAWQTKNLKGIQNNCVLLDPPNSLNVTQCRKVISESVNGNRWLTVTDQECCALPDQRDNSATNAHVTDYERNQKETNGKLPLKKTQSDSAYEIVTKVKKLEPETGTHNKHNSKRKMNETIFCLVSVPVKSESDASDTDKNNNDLSGGIDQATWLYDSNSGFPDRNLLRTSSTDLELQSLTGSMTSKTRQKLSRQMDYKETTDPSLVHPAKHRELTYSGSWPGDQYRDQQTQTNFRAELKGSEFIYDSKLNIPSNKCISANYFDSTLVGLKEQGLPPNGCEKDKYNIKGQMYFSPSSNSAFTRTPSSVIQLPTAQPQKQHFGSSYGNIQEKEQSEVGKGDVVKGDVPAPSDNKELFGQFLLKPVSRRPWDAISELESLNKEFQGQEESEINVDGVEHEEKQQEDSFFTDMPSTPTKHRSTKTMINCNKQNPVVPEVPIFKPEIGKSNFESWSAGHESDTLQLCDGQQNSSEKEDPSSKWAWSADGKVSKETRSLEARSSTNKEPVVTSSLSQRTLPSGSSGTNLNKMISNFNCREVNGSRFYVDDSLLDLARLSKATIPKTDKSEQIDPITCLPVNTNQSLPKQDPSYLGFGQQFCANTTDEFYGKENAIEIPENESIQARATRILGIEVAMDFLISSNSSNGKNHPPKHALDLELPTAERLGAVVEKDGQKQEHSSFSREKLGLKESFIKGEVKNSSKSATQKSKCQNTDKNASNNLATERTLGSENTKRLEKEEQDPNLFCKSVICYLDETKVASSSEKKARGTSKKIETLQGKLASIPSRTAMDRLVRMKEVDSVSRMRRLSCKSTDSGDEADDEKQHQVQEEKGSTFAVDGSDASCKVTHTGIVSKQVISLNQSVHLSPKSKKRPEGDLFCLEVYDPARVERV
ncbi:junctional protein associated with coronary artery disease [Rhinatrema bivittatum]|uniref:junctional protein associated with coronary artery disease n=1 Tax=Rhinatrema bivittatum TaxID=194408 RepID=UPI00112D7400|nr:junctional protein associated with coronary artery disease [Rhinatrema bivittatum]XP_029444477.1 junctional protein associated with coronary artery disease [Rhinatrema bivittatum]XP_029444478.1 junctional protein associated with coronary artery disease [Rhinatrema bivittatum]XP_029444479.1 junctional protein associated with coronary artery disease [Rhinatrema bivittatum]XP_029444480.1 junctional protein associated with coronary artery disease [Rhinatrema bivittatum]XP_029444481.1 junctional